MKKWVLFLIVLLGTSGASASPRWIEPDNAHTEGFYSIGKKCPPDKSIGSWQWGIPCEEGEECIVFRWEYVCEKNCNDLNSFPIEKGKEKDFDICSNRKTVKSMLEGYQSQLKECPENFIHDKYGNCRAIDGRYVTLNLTEEQCQGIDRYYWMYGSCVRHDQVDSAISKLSQKECKEYPDLTWDKQKQECSKPGRIDDICLNNFMFSGKDGGYCISCEERDLKIESSPLECNKCKTTYFWDEDDICLPDEEEHSKRAKKGQILLDIDDVYETTISVKNIYRPGYRKKDSKKNKHLRYGYVSCDVNRDVRTSEYYCDLCPNREYVDGKCILKKE